MSVTQTLEQPLSVGNSPLSNALIGRKRKAPQQVRWTYRQYQRLAKLGVLFKRRVELLDGKIIELAPQGDGHVTSTELTREAIAKAFGSGYWVRAQSPVHLDAWSAPEPDIAVITGTPRENYGKGHPKTVLLVVEVSDTSLSYDRRDKGPRYAKAGYADYWIINLAGQCVEVYRNPVQDPSAPLGWRYGEVSILKPPATITPLAAFTPIPVADLLPMLPTIDKPANS